MDDEERSYAEQRLAVLDVLVAAQDRFDEVVSAVEHAIDDEDAVARVAALLGLAQRHLAHAVLDQQLRRRTGAARDRLRRERDELREQLSG